MIALQLYQGDFENQLIKATGDFYLQDESALASQSLSQYVVKVQNVLAMETKMVNSCLDVSTLPAIINICYEHLIVKMYPFMLAHADFEAFLK